MENLKTKKENSTWSVRRVTDSPSIFMEGFEMYRVLDGSGFKGVGCEYVVLDPGKVLEPHVHKDAHAIIFVIKGNGKVLVEKEELPLSDNDIINIPPNVRHGLIAGDKDLVVYGFQSPAIIDDQDKQADIYFTQDNRQGAVLKSRT